MHATPGTRPSLLLRLRDAGDREAWTQFVEVYAPLIYGFARKHGLQDADAADLTQESLRQVAAAIKQLEYDPRRGTFRGWLFTVVRHQLFRWRARQDRPGRGSGDSEAQRMLQEMPAPKQDEAALWDEEYQRRQFAWAAERVRRQVQESTWQAFWRTAVEGQSGQEVAQALGTTVAAVYLAKSRVMARLKEQVRQLEETQ
jgi:RNA polymerase sigma-70 factor (ECF subfamily)